ESNHGDERNYNEDHQHDALRDCERRFRLRGSQRIETRYFHKALRDENGGLCIFCTYDVCFWPKAGMSDPVFSQLIASRRANQSDRRSRLSSQLKSLYSSKGARPTNYWQGLTSEAFTNNVGQSARRNVDGCNCRVGRVAVFQERRHFRRPIHLTCGGAPAIEATSLHRQARLTTARRGRRPFSEVTDLLRIAFAHRVRKSFAVGILISVLTFPFSLHAESAAHWTPVPLPDEINATRGPHTNNIRAEIEQAGKRFDVDARMMKAVA